MFLSSIKKCPGIPRRNKLFSSLNCNVFLGATFHRHGELVWKDSDLLDKIPHQLLIIGEHLILCLCDGFSQCNNPIFITLLLSFWNIRRFIPVCRICIYCANFVVVSTYAVSEAKGYAFCAVRLLLEMHQDSQVYQP